MKKSFKTSEYKPLAFLPFVLLSLTVVALAYFTSISRTSINPRAAVPGQPTPTPPVSAIRLDYLKVCYNSVKRYASNTSSCTNVLEGNFVVSYKMTNTVPMSSTAIPSPQKRVFVSIGTLFGTNSGYKEIDQPVLSSGGVYEAQKSVTAKLCGDFKYCLQSPTGDSFCSQNVVRKGTISSGTIGPCKTLGRE